VCVGYCVIMRMSIKLYDCIIIENLRSLKELGCTLFPCRVLSSKKFYLQVFNEATIFKQTTLYKACDL
jgi:hypothetical protein